MLIHVVSDTSDRIHLGQQPSLARFFVGVSDSTITSFSWLVIEIDTAKNSRAKSAANLVPTGSNAIARWTSWSVCNDSAVKRCRLLPTSIWEGGDRFLPNKAKKYFVFNAGRCGLHVPAAGCWGIGGPAAISDCESGGARWDRLRSNASGNIISGRRSPRRLSACISK
jgi:hypothetical protein